MSRRSTSRGGARKRPAPTTEAGAMMAKRDAALRDLESPICDLLRLATVAQMVICQDRHAEGETRLMFDLFERTAEELATAFNASFNEGAQQ